MTFPELCSPGNSNGQKSSSLCVPENSWLWRTTQPNTTQVELRVTPLIYLWQGQTQPLQSPILCLISDELNSLLSLMNLDKIPFNLSWLNLVRLPQPLNFDPCSSWANVGMWKSPSFPALPESRLTTTKSSPPPTVWSCPCSSHPPTQFLLPSPFDVQLLRSYRC